jgi:hypothetical protein
MSYCGHQKVDSYSSYDNWRGIGPHSYRTKRKLVSYQAEQNRHENGRVLVATRWMEMSQKTRTHGRLVIGGSSIRLCLALQAFWPADKFGTHSYLPRGAYEKLWNLLKVHPSSHREDVHRTGGISLKTAAYVRDYSSVAQRIYGWEWK